MLPSLKVKSLSHRSASNRKRRRRFGRSTHRRWLASPCCGLIGALLVSLPKSALAQGDHLTIAELSPSVAEVSPTVALEVHGDRGTADCPGAHQIRDALVAHRANTSTGPLRLRIEFQKQNATSVATLVATGARSGSRELRIDTGDCQALLAPLVVSLALWLDPDAPLTSPAPVSSSNAPLNAFDSSAATGDTSTAPLRQNDSSSTSEDRLGQTSSTTPPPLPRATDQKKLEQQEREQPRAEDASKRKDLGADARLRTKSLGLGLDLGPQLIVGMVPETAYGLELQASVRYGLFSGRAAAVDCVAEETAYGDGTVRAQSYFGRLGLCAQWERFGSFSFSVCQSTSIGQLSVKGRGYGADRASSPWFVALGGFADVTWTSRHRWGLYLRAGAFVPTTQHHFNVDGFSGNALGSRPFGAWVGSGMAFRFL